MNILSAREMGELAGGKPRAAPVPLELALVCPDGANPAPYPGCVLPAGQGENGGIGPEPPCASEAMPSHPNPALAFMPAGLSLIHI